MVERRVYLEKLKKWKDKDLIKVVTGIRRCGKSTLFELYINYLKSIGIEDNHIISINLEDLDNEFNIINCNSGIERFYNDYQLEGVKVFDNLNLCKDQDILKIVKNTKGILIW
jgi:predicted AAA+ superfamily ATPase